jgi:peptide/nickel transport system substrate-binding protein
MTEVVKTSALPVAISAAVIGSLIVLAPGLARAQDNRTLTIVLSDEPVSLDACSMDTSYNGRVVKQNIAETLTEIDPNDGSLKPRLAKSWEKVNDTTWRFTLQENVAFSDGAPFNAETAAGAIARTMDKALDCSTRQRFFNTLVLTPKVIDATTLEISANEPVPILPTQLGTLPIVSPNQPRDRLTNTPVGTGPYVLTRWDTGSEIVLTRNENYWGPQPQAASAKFVWRGESSVRASMVKIGEADFAPNIAVQDATDPVMDISYLNAETTWLKIDVEVPPLNDIRVRRALNYAVDRNALHGTIFPKAAVPATQLVIPAVAGHNHDLDKKVWPYDPEKAKQLLAEAKNDGAPVDTEIMIHGRTNFYPNNQEAMEAVAAMFTAVGLNVKLEMLDRAVWNEINRKPHADGRKPNLVDSQHDNDKGDAVFTFDPRYGCNGISSTTCWPEVDEMVKRASALSGDERVKLWQELFRIVYEEKVPDVYLFHMVGYSRVGSRIDFKPSVATNSEVQIAEIKFK